MPLLNTNMKATLDMAGTLLHRMGSDEKALKAADEIYGSFSKILDDLDAALVAVQSNQSLSDLGREEATDEALTDGYNKLYTQYGERLKTLENQREALQRTAVPQEISTDAPNFYEKARDMHASLSAMSQPRLTELYLQANQSPGPDKNVFLYAIEAFSSWPMEPLLDSRTIENGRRTRAAVQNPAAFRKLAQTETHIWQINALLNNVLSTLRANGLSAAVNSPTPMPSVENRLESVKFFRQEVSLNENSSPWHAAIKEALDTARAA